MMCQLQIKLERECCIIFERQKHLQTAMPELQLKRVVVPWMQCSHEGQHRFERERRQLSASQLHHPVLPRLPPLQVSILRNEADQQTAVVATDIC